MNQPALSADDFDWVCAMVRERAGIRLEAGKEYLVESRLSGLIRGHPFESIHELVESMRSGPFGPMHEAVIEAMTTNETSFFRDQSFFDGLRDAVIPMFVETRADQRRLSLWCAASSSGQEPYSVLMMLEESFPELRSWMLDFYVSDISSEMIMRTRVGIYSEHEVRRGLSQERIDRFFSQTTSGYQIHRELRDRLRLVQVNLMDEWPPMPPLDVILVRNVLIYFDDDLRERILRRMYSRLAPDGLMFLGTSETLVSLDVPVVRDDQLVGCYRAP